MQPLVSALSLLFHNIERGHERDFEVRFVVPISRALAKLSAVKIAVEKDNRVGSDKDETPSDVDIKYLYPK